ncbi:hypothetical protein JB92DRAFT_2688906, partial [Gautieria morchelliformis]
IPRPRNAYILLNIFQCLFVNQHAVPASVEKDHRDIRRIAGRVWKSITCARYSSLPSIWIPARQVLSVEDK